MGSVRLVRSGVGALVAAALLISLVGCGSSSDWSPSDATRCAALCAPVVCSGCERVRLVTSDNVTLHGILYGTGATAVVMSNEYVSGQRIWADLPSKLAGAGYTALTYDYRGLGESSGTFDPTRAELDLQAAVRFVHRRGARAIVLIGSSLGGLSSAAGAQRLAARALVLLSPARSFAGRTVSDAVMAGQHEPKLFAWFADDKVNRQAERLFRSAAPPKRRVVVAGSGHGVQLLDRTIGGGFEDMLLGWLREIVPVGP